MTKSEDVQGPAIAQKSFIEWLISERIASGAVMAGWELLPGISYDLGLFLNRSLYFNVQRFEQTEDIACMIRVEVTLCEGLMTTPDVALELRRVWFTVTGGPEAHALTQTSEQLRMRFLRCGGDDGIVTGEVIVAGDRYRRWARGQEL